MPNEGNRATYRYTADEQREIDVLRRRYAVDAPEYDLAALQKIDREVTRQATIKAVAVGVIGTLVFGGGLSMVIEFHLMAPGIVTGCCGIAVMAAMPAFYERLLKRERQKAAPRVAELLKRTEKRE